MRDTALVSEGCELSVDELHELVELLEQLLEHSPRLTDRADLYQTLSALTGKLIRARGWQVATAAGIETLPPPPDGRDVYLTSRTVDDALRHLQRLRRLAAADPALSARVGAATQALLGPPLR